jgi:hypothetical protein
MNSTCGMRRFDKHRMEALQGQEKGVVGEKWIQDRLRQREEQDRILFRNPSSASNSAPVVPVSVVPVPVVPVSAPTPYTPWKTPSTSQPY